ncbi:hypothetical protein TrRE_jg3684 [Triparma retinervis]|uniref:Uncharacterized protein n=1 Tax=Triparma retinervis TaxID=2557542 RepID=A0A9W7AH91_9STRA|nr:hypothetical protein TrRE_jg3684 [Triparma retinervis]
MELWLVTSRTPTGTTVRAETVMADITSATAKFAFTADPNYPQTMSLEPGVKLIDVESAGDGWMWGTNATTQQRGLFPESYVAVEVVAHKPNAVPPPIPKRDKVDRSSTSSAMSKRSSAGGGDRSSTSSVTTAVDPKGEADAAAQEEEEEDEPRATLAYKRPPPPIVLMKKNKQSDEVEIDAQNTLSNDVDSFVNKWRSQAATALVNRNFKEYYQIKSQMTTLLEWRRQMRLAYSDFLAEKADAGQYLDVKKSILKLIEATKQQSESFSVPRTEDGAPASVTNCAITSLYQLHKDMRERMNESSKLPEGAAEQYKKEVDKGLRKRAGQEGKLHLFVHQKAAIFSAGEGCQLLYSLWSKRRKDFVSDEFMVALTAAGMPDDISLMEKLNTLFIDLTQTDFEDGLVLVCRIYRIGKLTSEDKASSSSGMMAMGNAAAPISDDRQIYKRHFGCSVVNLTELNVHKLLIGEELNPENTPIYQPRNGNEHNFSSLHEAIASNRSEEYEVVPKTNGIALGISLFEGDYKAALEKDSRLLGISPTLRRSMQGIVDTGEERNDLYITLTGGDFSQDSKKSAKNIEVKISCLMDTGAPVECLIRGSGPQGMLASSYRSTVYYHTNSPPFNETVKLVIPSEQGKFERCHLLFTFYHCSGTKPRAPFGFSFLELADSVNGAAIKDKVYSCSSYKMMDNMMKGNMILPKYLQQKAKLTVRNFRTGLSKQDEIFRVKTTMCSTKKTQNGVLHDLINWRQLDGSQLEVVLKKCLGQYQGVASLTHDEIFKFLKEIMDALCAIFAEKRSSMKSILPVFHLFSYVLEHFSKKHFKEYCPILEGYIKESFNNQRMHKILLQCVDYYMKWIEDKTSVKSNPKDLQVFLNFMSSFNYIIWIINVSRKQDPTAGKTINEFKGALLDLMTRVNRLMQMDEPVKITIVRGKTLNHFPSVIDHLLDIFSPAEVSVIAAGFLDVVPLSAKTGTFNKDKLELVQHICKSTVFKDGSARQEVLPAILKTLMEFLKPCERVEPARRELLTRSIKILLTMLQVIQEEDDKQAVVTILPIIPHLIFFTNNGMARLMEKKDERGDGFDETLSNCATSLVTLLYLMDDAQFNYFLDLDLQDEMVLGSTEKTDKKERMRIVLGCLGNLWDMNITIYPSIWLVFHVLQAEVTVKIMEWTNSFLTLDEYKKTANVDIASNETSLWEMIYAIGMKIITFDLLAGEGANETKRSVLENNAYDMDLRCCVSSVLHNNWDTLSGESKLLLVDDLVQTLLGQVGSECLEVATMCKQFFFDLLKCEFVATSDFANVRDHTISSVGAIVTEQMEKDGAEGGDETQNPLFLLFKDDLEVQFMGDDVLKCEAGSQFLKEIKQLFTLLVALAKFPKTAAHEQERCFAYSQLMDYLLKMNRTENYTRYAHQMSQEMLGLGLNIEAGKALLLHANLLAWDDAQLPDFRNENKEIFPAQASMQRKERLYVQAMQMFDKAQYWEGSLKLCEELNTFYINGLYDYDKVTNTLKKMADYYKSIKNTDRFYPSTFRVGYYGDFGPEFKNCDFIYRGEVLESIGDFTNRIKGKFPAATMLGVKIDAGSEHKDNTSGEQYLQISKVTAITVKSDWEKSGEWVVGVVPRHARDFEGNNEVSEFYYSRPFRKKKEKSENEFLDLWVEKKVLTVEEVLPNTQRRSKVVKVENIVVNPLENAVAEIVKKNAELREKFGAMKNLPDGAADNSYTMALNGVVDAAVNGGIGNYRTFINGQYKEKNPEIYEDVCSSGEKRDVCDRLIAALKEQLEILEGGVEIHGRKCSESLKPLHDHIVGMFGKMKVSTQEMLGEGGKK